MENKITFLIAAIADAQELIKFIETKVAVVITILSGFLIVLFASLEKYLEYLNHYSFLWWIFLGSTVTGIVCCVIVVISIMAPVSCPEDNIVDSNHSPSLKFYLAKNKYDNIFHLLSNSKNNKLDCSFLEYKDHLKHKKIVDCLILELLKISYIRNQKSEKFKLLLRLVLFTGVAFIIFYITSSYEYNLFPKANVCLKCHD